MKLKQELDELLKVALDYPELKFILDSKTRIGAAVAVLFRGESLLSSEVLLILRAETVSTHKGQVAFPGGGMDPGDLGDPSQTALRECEEEVGLSRSQIEICGQLPSFPTLSGDFSVVPVVGWVNPHWNSVFFLQSSEVAFAEWVSVKQLLETRCYQDAPVLDAAIKTPVFFWGERKMWGLTAWIFDLILNRYDTLSL